MLTICVILLLAAIAVGAVFVFGANYVSVPTQEVPSEAHKSSVCSDIPEPVVYTYAPIALWRPKSTIRMDPPIEPILRERHKQRIALPPIVEEWDEWDDTPYREKMSHKNPYKLKYTTHHKKATLSAHRGRKAPKHPCVVGW